MGTCTIDCMTLSRLHTRLSEVPRAKLAAKLVPIKKVVLPIAVFPVA